MITTQELYAATDSGRMIITHYYPAAVPGKNFAIREGDSHPSAAMKLIGGIWRVTDFGDEGKALSPIDVAMQAEGLDFAGTMARLGEIFHVEGSKPEPLPVVWKSTKKADGLHNVKTEPIKADQDLRWWFGSLVRVAGDVLDRYGWEKVTYYERATGGRLMCCTPNDAHPVFRRICTTDNGNYFYKYYQPREEVRFFYEGDKPKDYINGWHAVKEAYDKKVKAYGEENGVEHVDGGDGDCRIDEVVICSGERDAMCCAALGCLPVWLNSETARIPAAMERIERMARQVYFVPDLDATGQRVARRTALAHDTWLMVELPDAMMEQRDSRGKVKKDLRDWCDAGSRRAFRQMLDAACRCRWYDERLDTDAKGNTQQKRVVSTADFLHFVHCLGFARYTDPSTRQTMYVEVRDNVMERTDPEHIRAAVTDYIMRGEYSKDIRNLYLNSARCGVSVLSDLKEIHPDITLTSKDSQAFVFGDRLVQVSASGVMEKRLSDSTTMVFAESVIDHNLKRMPAQFAADADGMVTPGKPVSSFFKYLISTSRMYWREELEHPDLEPSRDYWAKQAGSDNYEAAYRFHIDGPVLTKQQKEEQRLNLSSKIFAIGYLLHSYKANSRPWAVWAMENHVEDEFQSSGGTGKSFFFRVLSRLVPTLTLNGAERDFMGDRALFDRYTATTRMIYIDEAPANMDIRGFYSMITGDFVVKRKYLDSAVVDFADSPKFAFSSNFPPPNVDPSTMRRFLFLLFSDYYHHQSEDNDYRQTRTIADDFCGRDICAGEEYTAEQWNADYNFLIDCVQYYLQQTAAGRKIEPDMAGLFSRVHERAIGPVFRDWADVYLSPASGNLDRKIHKQEVYNSYMEQSGSRKISATAFKRTLRIYCREDGIELNPQDVEGYSPKDGRIISRVTVMVGGLPTTQTVECLYFRRN